VSLQRPSQLWGFFVLVNIFSYEAAAETWECNAAEIKQSTAFVAAESPAQAHGFFKGETNIVPFFSADIAKYGMVNSYDGVRLNCKREIVENIGEVPLCTALSSENSAGYCKKPNPTFTLKRGLPNGDIYYIKNRCDSKLQKFKNTSSFDGVLTLLDEKFSYQIQHQIFKGTHINSEPSITFDTHTGDMSIDGILIMPGSWGGTFYATYKLTTVCSLSK